MQVPSTQRIVVRSIQARAVEVAPTSPLTRKEINEAQATIFAWVLMGALVLGILTGVVSR